MTTMSEREYREKLARLEAQKNLYRGRIAKSASDAGYRASGDTIGTGREMTAYEMWDATKGADGFSPNLDFARGRAFGNGDYAVATGPGIAANTTPYRDKTDPALRNYSFEGRGRAVAPAAPSQFRDMQEFLTGYARGQAPNQIGSAPNQAMDTLQQRYVPQQDSRAVPPKVSNSLYLNKTPEQKLEEMTGQSLPGRGDDRDAVLRTYLDRIEESRRTPQLTMQERARREKTASEEYKEAVAAIQATEKERAEIERQEAEAARKEQIERDRMQMELDKQEMAESGATRRSEIAAGAQVESTRTAGEFDVKRQEKQNEAAIRVQELSLDGIDKESSTKITTSLIDSGVARTRGAAKMATDMFKADRKKMSGMIERYAEPADALLVEESFNANPALFEKFKNSLLSVVKSGADLSEKDLAEGVAILVKKAADELRSIK